MKNLLKIAFLSVFTFGAIMIPQSADAAPAREPGAAFADVEGKEWLLAEVRVGGKTIVMDRQKLALDNFIGIYSMNFQNARLSGMGAPNRYTAPYTADANRSLNIGLVASTMMAAFREPDGLAETEFFNYLSKARRWDLNGGKLEIYSSNSNGSEAVLIFNQR